MRDRDSVRFSVRVDASRKIGLSSVRTNKLERGFSLGVGIEDGSRSKYTISNMKANDTSVACIVLLSDGHHIAGAVRDRWLPR